MQENQPRSQKRSHKTRPAYKPRQNKWRGRKGGAVIQPEQLCLWFKNCASHRTQRLRVNKRGCEMKRGAQKKNKRRKRDSFDLSRSLITGWRAPDCLSFRRVNTFCRFRVLWCLYTGRAAFVVACPFQWLDVPSWAATDAGNTYDR